MIVACTLPKQAHRCKPRVRREPVKAVQLPCAFVISPIPKSIQISRLDHSQIELSKDNFPSMPPSILRTVLVDGPRVPAERSDCWRRLTSGTDIRKRAALLLSLTGRRVLDHLRDFLGMGEHGDM